MSSPRLFGVAVDEDLFMVPLSVPEVANSLHKSGTDQGSYQVLYWQSLLLTTIMKGY